MLIYYVHKLLEENKIINKQNHYLLQNIQNLTHYIFIELIKCHLLNFQLFQFLKIWVIVGRS